MQKRLNKGFFVLLAMMLLVSSGNGAYAQSKIGQARQLAVDKKYDKAIEVYTEVYNRSPILCTQNI